MRESNCLKTGSITKPAQRKPHFGKNKHKEQFLKTVKEKEDTLYAGKQYQSCLTS